MPSFLSLWGMLFRRARLLSGRIGVFNYCRRAYGGWRRIEQRRGNILCCEESIAAQLSWEDVCYAHPEIPAWDFEPQRLCQRISSLPPTPLYLTSHFYNWSIYYIDAVTVSRSPDSSWIGQNGNHLFNDPFLHRHRHRVPLHRKSHLKSLAMKNARMNQSRRSKALDLL